MSGGYWLEREPSSYILTRVSSFGQIQYIPPGRSSDLMTLVATIAVLQAGQGLPAKAEPLSPMLERAVLLIFFSAMNHSSLKIVLNSVTTH